MDNRITELEIKVAHQEFTIEQLNQVITEQQQEITDIKLLLEALNSKVKNMDIPEKNQAEPPPPHY